MGVLLNGLSAIEALLWSVALTIGFLGIVVGALGILVAWRIYRLSRATAHEAAEGSERTGAAAVEGNEKKIKELMKGMAELTKQIDEWKEEKSGGGNAGTGAKE